ncbi:MAG: UvrD-helicase domain-containing protein [Candidatus Hydrogenedentes bacterium]|nr:UvrD-helicase domain-containing protein [Candidatus Hydrogenedentota bacterium]
MRALNPAQLSAVRASEPAVLVLAGAGTGKTRVIVERIIWLIVSENVPPNRILAVTFTNKAADEMKTRIYNELSNKEVFPWVGTFHSFGLHFLRRYTPFIPNLREGFVVFDEDDQVSLMKRVFKENPILSEQFLPREAVKIINGFKQRIISPKDLPEFRNNVDLITLWDSYHKYLRDANAVDFDDLISLPVVLLEENNSIKERLRNFYLEILVDEYQDTNHAQFRLLQALKGERNRIFVVGDEDQCIYSWRGSELDNILNFERHFDGAKIYRLEQNYRSTKNILISANNLVSHNRFRIGKKLWTENEPGEKISFYWADSDVDEAEWVINDILKHNYPLNCVAILFRTNNQSRPFEESLLKRNIPYVFIGGIKFYARKEVKDLLAYLRIVSNEEDDDAVRRVINVPHRDIGQATLQKIEEYAKLRNSHLMKVMREIEYDHTFNARARQAIVNFIRLIDEIKLHSIQSDIGEVVKFIVDKTGYWDYVKSISHKEGYEKDKIVMEFISVCDQNKKHYNSVTEFLQSFSLMTDIDLKEVPSRAIQLLTCHSTKGLEFDYVYLTGMEEGLLPYLEDEEFIDLNNPKEIEEERRLCYVAMTRARKRLVITGASKRQIFGRTLNTRQISRFIFEMGFDKLEVLRVPSARSPYEEDIKEDFVECEKREVDDSPKYKMGTRVWHAKFGYGIVLNTEGKGDKMKARVKFDSGRTAVLMVSMAPMEIVERRKN